MSDDNNQLAEYCVVLVEPNYHPQLCGDVNPISLEVAKTLLEPHPVFWNHPEFCGLNYQVMTWKAYQDHKIGCKDCERIALLTLKVLAIKAGTK